MKPLAIVYLHGFNSSPQSVKGRLIARAAAAFYAGALQFVGGGGDHGWADFGGEVASVLRFAGCRARGLAT